MQSIINKLRHEHSIIGFVPTMGSFHEGHLALMRESSRQCPVTIVSIFINPLQFGPREDYLCYPRNETRDIELAKDQKVDYLFIPTTKEMYPAGFETRVLTASNLTANYEGAIRPGHFEGVASVVAKLFNIIKPDFVFFGQKDAQQVAVIRRMIKDLNFGLTMKVLPTVREKDGLAMSSRNVYLSSPERKAAPVLFRSLNFMKSMIQLGEKNCRLLLAQSAAMVRSEKLARIIYLSIVKPCNFAIAKEIKGAILVIMAARIGKVKLIDNLEVEIKKR